MATLDRIAAMKRVYSQYMAELPNWDRILLDLIEDDTDPEWNGKMDGIFVPFHNPSGLRASGAHKESATLNTYVKEAYGQMQAYLRSFHIKVELTAEELHGIQMGAGGTLSIKAKEVESKTEAFRHKLTRMLYGTGYGNLGTVAAVSAGATTTITFDDDTNMEWFDPSLFVDFWAPAFPPVTRHGAATDTAYDVGFEITSVNKTAKTAVLAGNTDTLGPDVVAGDHCYHENVGIGVTGAQYGTGTELQGLQALVSDGVTPNLTLQGSAYATNPSLKSIIDSAASDREFTLDRYQAFIDKVENECGKNVGTKITGQGQRRKMLQIGYKDVRHVSNEMRIGWKVMTLNGEDILIDRMCPPHVLYCLDLTQFKRGTLFPLKSMDKSESGERKSNQTVYEMIWGTTQNLYIVRSNCHGRLQDLLEP